MRYLCVEIYKSVNDRLHERHLQHKSAQSKPNNIWHQKYSDEGAKIWNHLPNLLKSAETLEIFKSLIKTWEGPNFKCNFWKHAFSE